MPQLIATIIVVVAAIIYMFQSFGGTGSKIEAMAQKANIITEINNIKSPLVLANKSKQLEDTAGTDTELAHTLEGLSALNYFDNLINNQINNSADNTGATNDDFNVYKTISFGGDTDVQISLVIPTDGSVITTKPGIFVKLGGSLEENKGLLESQIAKDLSAIAAIDRLTDADNEVATLNTNGDITGPTNTGDGTKDDGMFTIYFKEIQAGLIQ